MHVFQIYNILTHKLRSSCPAACGQVVKRRVWDANTFQFRYIYYAKLSHILPRHLIWIWTIAFGPFEYPKKGLSMDYTSFWKLSQSPSIGLEYLHVNQKKNLEVTSFK